MPTHKQSLDEPSMNIFKSRINADWHAFELYLNFNFDLVKRDERKKFMRQEIERLYAAVEPMCMLRFSASEDEWKRPVWIWASDVLVSEDDWPDDKGGAHVMVLIHPEKRVDLALAVYVSVPAWYTDEAGICSFRCTQYSSPAELDFFDDWLADVEAELVPAEPASLPAITERRGLPVANEHAIMFRNAQGGWDLIDLKRS